jgi:hypothetical protein
MSNLYRAALYKSVLVLYKCQVKERAVILPERMSDRHAKSGEDMMEVLAHDIMRYETLSEQSDLFALASALAGTVHCYRVE